MVKEKEVQTGYHRMQWLPPELKKGDVQITKANVRCSQDNFFVASEVLKWNLGDFSHKIMYPGKEKLVGELSQWEMTEHVVIHYVSSLTSIILG